MPACPTWTETSVMPLSAASLVSTYRVRAWLIAAERLPPATACARS
jgi:hypothetical protein